MPEYDAHQWDPAAGGCTCGWQDAHGHGMSHLHIEQAAFREKPHVWVQWKGTDVCCDVRCLCGAGLHYDGDFMYFLKCPCCGRLWEVGTYVALYEVKDDRVAADDGRIKVPDQYD